MTDIWYATTRSWEEVVWYAEHWYCSIYGPKNDPEDEYASYGFEINYVLSSEDAKRLSEPDYKRVAGDVTSRFLGKEPCLAAAVAAFKYVAKDDDILLHDDSPLNPSQVLVGPASLAQVWVDAEAATSRLDSYADEFYDRWYAEMAKLGINVREYRSVNTWKSKIGNEIICKVVDGEWVVDESQTQLEDAPERPLREG